MAAKLVQVVPLPDYSTECLSDLLKGIDRVDRKMAIGLENFSDYTLESLGTHFESGSANDNVPQQIPSQTVGLFSAPLSQGPARGTAGVFSYYIQAVNKTVHVMWSLPFDDTSYTVCWNVFVRDGSEKPSCSVYDHMYHGSGGFSGPTLPGQQFGPSTIDGFQLSGKMTEKGQGIVEAILEVEFKMP